MRIDFLGRYNDVQRLLDPKQESRVIDQSKSSEFATQIDNIKSENHNQSNQLATDSGLASLAPKVLERKLSERVDIELESPTFEALPITPFEPKEHINQQTNVKTPSLVSVTRIETALDANPNQSIIEPKTPPNDKRSQIENLVRAEGLQQGIDPELILSIVKHESSFNPRAISSDGHASKGLFQLLDSTGREQQQRLGLEGEYRPFDPEFNSKLGINYLKYLHSVFDQPTELGSNYVTRKAADSASLEKFAVASFNAGEGRVASAQARAEKDGKDPSIFEDVRKYLPESTQQYVSRVISTKQKN